MSYLLGVGVAGVSELMAKWQYVFSIDERDTAVRESLDICDEVLVRNM